MDKTWRVFSIEEYMFLHKTFLKSKDDSKLFKRIKAKKGIGLDKSEINYVKRKFLKWKEANNVSDIALTPSNGTEKLA